MHQLRKSQILFSRILRTKPGECQLRARFDRTLENVLRERIEGYPAIFLTGPRQSGKTTLARSTFPDFEYFSFEELATRDQARSDPDGFLHRLRGCSGAILDEVQNVPSLFSALQRFLDERQSGPLILTGSQQFLLSERISQSLAGRVSILELLPFSLAELQRRPAIHPQDFGSKLRDPKGEIGLEPQLLAGLFPPVHDRGLDPFAWYDGYVRTYVERDVRLMANIGDLDSFTRFLGLCAGRAGGLLNLSSLGSDAGISHSTARKWISVLRASYVVDLVQPHFENFSKRLIKAPKLQFLDTGLLCFLLGIRNVDHLRTHPVRGGVFESLVFSELKKMFLHHGERAPIFHWRDTKGHELDFLLEFDGRRLPIEAKSGRTIAGDAFSGLDYYAALAEEKHCVLIYGGDDSYEMRDRRILSWRSIS